MLLRRSTRNKAVPQHDDQRTVGNLDPQHLVVAQVKSGSKQGKKAAKRATNDDQHLQLCSTDTPRQGRRTAKRACPASQSNKTPEQGLHQEEEGDQKREALQVELNRLQAMLTIERACIADVAQQRSSTSKAPNKPFVIIGVDEVGVGPLAGPLVSCAVALNLTEINASAANLGKFADLNDSKKLKPYEREKLSEIIKQNCIAYEIASLPSQTVDELNPRGASIEAMRRAVTALLDGPLANAQVHVLVDYHTIPDLPTGVAQSSFPKGDAKSLSIAAASVVAKVFRDAHMSRLHEEYPQFCFDRNAGYGTRDHLFALQAGSLCPEHRLSYAPVRIANEKMQKSQQKDGGTNVVAPGDGEGVVGAGNSRVQSAAKSARRRGKIVAVPSLDSMAAIGKVSKRAQKSVKETSIRLEPLEERHEPNLVVMT